MTLEIKCEYLVLHRTQFRRKRHRVWDSPWNPSPWQARRAKDPAAAHSCPVPHNDPLPSLCCLSWAARYLGTGPPRRAAEGSALSGQSVGGAIPPQPFQAHSCGGHGCTHMGVPSQVLNVHVTEHTDFCELTHCFPTLFLSNKFVSIQGLEYTVLYFLLKFCHPQAV